jgi:cytochrome c oxidase subunit 2
MKLQRGNVSRSISRCGRGLCRAATGGAFAVLAGCSKELYSPESALNPAGPQAQRIASLTWLFIWVCVVVYVLVMLTLAGAIVHRRHGKSMVPTNEHFEPEPESEQRIWKVVFGAAAITVVTLFVLLGSDFATGRALHRLSENAEEIHVRLIGHQWWWEINYDDWPSRFGERGPSNTFRTANEIHVPVDNQHPVTLELKLDSHDVIHSFWVPNLNGKRDLIPGHPTDIFIQVDHPGVYWGECAEYCGYQHANMRIAVVAEPPDQFRQWLASQQSSAPEPLTDMQKKGREVFLHSTCVMCHAIGGTPAHGLVGPDLTHVASRQLLAAGAAPNTPGHLAGWVVNPQKIKPGCNMPQNNIGSMDLRALLEYLETLR